MLEIKSMYAYVAQNKEGEGIMAASMVIEGVPLMMPLIGADIDRIKSLRATADQISQQTGIPYKIYRFDNKTDVTEEI